jgi:CBS domain-containing protein
MGYRNRGFDALRDDADYEETRNRRLQDEPFRRGYGGDYRGYSRGYNMNREPNYRTEYDRGFTGWGSDADENYGRSYSDFDRGTRRESFYGQGPMRSHLRCRDIMTRNVTTCQRNTPIAEAARIMRDEDVGALPVVGEDGRVEGIVTDRDLVVSGLTSDRPEAELRVEDCMSTDLFTANQNDRIVDVIREMGDHQVRRIPIVDGRNRLVGIIAMADIATQTDKDMELAEALEDVSKPSSFLGRLANLFNW